jgi:HD superfamily phosphodiesterase
MAQSAIDKIKNEMMEYFGSDQKRIDHTLKVLDYVRRINSVEKADPLVVEVAAIVHDIGIHAAEEKYRSSAGKYQELEGPPIARRILQRNGFAESDTHHICAIVANHHSAKNIDTPEFRVVWDSDWLVNIPDEVNTQDKASLAKLIERIFKTDTGRKIAGQVYLSPDESEVVT